MGLDHWLEGELYLSNYDDTVKNIKNNLKHTITETDNFEIKTISIEFVVWRKINAIHKFFVEKVQDGVDDCKSYYVELDILIELKNLINEVIKNKDKAESLLPTQSGFFFGSIDYDSYYYEELIETKKKLDIIIKFVEKNPKWNIKYYSSW